MGKIEIFDPVKDFYSMRSNEKKEIGIYWVIPVIAAIFAGIIIFLSIEKPEFNVSAFFEDINGILINTLSLFISFSMAYLSIIATSGSRNVDELKITLSKKYKIKHTKEYCSLYQVLTNEITYSLEIQIFFLLLIFLEKLLTYLLNESVILILLTISVMVFMHILGIMLLTVKEIYYSFWKSR